MLYLEKLVLLIYVCDMRDEGATFHKVMKCLSMHIPPFDKILNTPPGPLTTPLSNFDLNIIHQLYV